MVAEASKEYQSRTPAIKEDYSNFGLHYNYDRKYQPGSYLDENQRAVESRSTDERGVSTPAFDEKQGTGQATVLSSASAYGQQIPPRGGSAFGANSSFTTKTTIQSTSPAQARPPANPKS